MNYITLAQLEFVMKGFTGLQSGQSKKTVSIPAHGLSRTMNPTATFSYDTTVNQWYLDDANVRVILF